MSKIRLIFIFLLFVKWTYSQNVETIISTDFSIRDFEVQNDSITFIKKRDVFLYDLNSKTSSNYFIGGYGMKIYSDPNSSTIISASSELVNNVSSVRFYDKKEKRVENVFYYRGGKIIDFLVISDKAFILSLTNNKIIFINFEETPRFLKTIELDLDSKSRRLIFQDNTLFFITDKGGIYKYSLIDNMKQLIYKCNDFITDFFINGKVIIYSTIDGKIVKINRINKKESVLLIKNNFILNNLIFEQNNSLICGSWNGNIYSIDIDDFSINEVLKYHDRSVLKILNYENNIFYSSGIDKTIKKWILN